MPKPIKKYQDGLKENMVGFTTELTKVFPDLRITSGFRPRAFTKQGAVSRHALGEAIDIEGRKDVYDYLWNTKEGVSLLNRFNVGVLDETTPEMLEKTGGIVQGMSGSPIIQDGRLIGAVTHVLINDPTRGYGISIEWMLSQMNIR